MPDVTPASASRPAIRIASERVGVPIAMQASAGGLIVGLAAIALFPLKGAEGLDVSPALAWPTPSLASDRPVDGAPALVTVEYLIDPKRRAQFARAMRSLRKQRLRDGAIRWALFGEADRPELYLETFLVDSWVEHLRQHERITVSDRAVNELALSFHISPMPPFVRHFVGERT